MLHQGELQLFIDGHESTVQGITREEAFSVRVSKPWTALRPKRIATFTARHPVEFPGNVSLRDYSETLVDIAYEVGRRQYRLSSNSRETVRTMIGWADEFSRRHENTDWSTIESFDEIDNFTEEKLRTARTRHDSPYVLVEFPDDTAYFEENDIGYPSFQSKESWTSAIRPYGFHSATSKADNMTRTLEKSWNGGKKAAPNARRHSQSPTDRIIVIHIQNDRRAQKLISTFYSIVC